MFSDGELLPSELARRADVLKHEIIAITDHVDASNIDITPKILKAIEDVNNQWEIKVVPGVEITHAPINSIDYLAKESKKLGAELVVVHGETLNEPVISGTNLAAIESGNVDILAHPGLITIEEAQIAKDNDVYLEISGRKGHCLSNGHVATFAREVGAKLLVNSDTHSPENLMDFQSALKVAMGAGLTEKEANKALIDNPKKLLKNKGIL